jgi:hypothetical protein
MGDVGSSPSDCESNVRILSFMGSMIRLVIIVLRRESLAGLDTVFLL